MDVTLLKNIQIFAGQSALKHIQEHGLNSDQVFAQLGASGGPKWFTLFGLDKYLLSEFYKDRTTPLNLVGTSAGAFRFSCYGQAQPLTAIEYLASEYSHTVYSDKPDRAEISLKARNLLDNLMGDNGAQEIAQNSVFKNHIIVARCLTSALASEKSLLQLPGLVGSYLLNRVGRKHLGRHYQRVIFKPSDSQLSIECPFGLSNETVALAPNNVKNAVLASGSIPAVMEGVSGIEGAANGMYRDGGIIDYHFDFKLSSPSSKGIVLYPHFSDKPKSGWFDKNLTRQPMPQSYDNVIMISPSQSYVESLPNKKIPDRTDFEKIEPTARIKYWREVLSAGDKLAQEFDWLINQSKDELVKHVKPFAFS